MARSTHIEMILLDYTRREGVGTVAGTEARELLTECQKRKAQSILYEDLYEGGILSKHVEASTLFNTVENNYAFIPMINYADGSDAFFSVGDGRYENLHTYSRVDWKEHSR